LPLFEDGADFFSLVRACTVFLEELFEAINRLIHFERMKNIFFGPDCRTCAAGRIEILQGPVRMVTQLFTKHFGP
jgi:hypothetical protein